VSRAVVISVEEGKVMETTTIIALVILVVWAILMVLATGDKDGLFF
jgi:hypothetical protein